jgi:glycosyltransferase involved in cell wall biosynthesis
MISQYTLSYVITTFNKLPYLKEVLNALWKNVQQDEEIIVIDGGSNDGTQDFLKQHFDNGKIQQYISEKDFGEAHGFNKGFLLARGEIIKLLTDDDVFYYPAIRACKRFMLENPSVEVIAGNILEMTTNIQEEVVKNVYDEDYILWTEKKKDKFFFNGQPLLIRRSALPHIGLFNTNFGMVDTEFSYRITYVKTINIAWCKNFLSIRIENANSNFLNYIKKYERNFKQLEVTYWGYNSIIQGKNSSVFWKSLKEGFKMLKLLKFLFWKFHAWNKMYNKNLKSNIKGLDTLNEIDLHSVYLHAESLLSKYNNTFKDSEIIYKVH